MKFYVIGIDDNKNPSFSIEVSEVIANHRIFSGGSRHLEIVKDLLPAHSKWIEIKVPLSKVFEEYKSEKEIVVFASGDPLFFGFANTIQRICPDAEIVLYPFFNSLQLLAHRLLLSYQDMHIVSLTGRPWDKFDEALINGYEKIGILTDNKLHTPQTIAERMLYYGYDNYKMSVGELLGNRDCEKYGTYSLGEISKLQFEFPNNILLQRISKRTRLFGIPEREFNLLNGRAKMITKMPIRLLSLSLLDLRDRDVMWDVGFCTGSVSIEAKIQFPHLQIYAFEKREEGRELIDTNARKFGAPGIHSFIGDFLDMDVSSLPKPNAIFIGGHGGFLKEIVHKIKQVASNDLLLVFNAVSDESCLQFHEALMENSMQLVQDIEIKIDDFNIIHVMKGSNIG